MCVCVLNRGNISRITMTRKTGKHSVRHTDTVQLLRLLLGEMVAHFRCQVNLAALAYDVDRSFSGRVFAQHSVVAGSIHRFGDHSIRCC